MKTGKPLRNYSEPTQITIMKAQCAGVEAARVAAIELAAAETVRADRAEHQVRSLMLEIGRIRHQLAQAAAQIASLKGRAA